MHSPDCALCWLKLYRLLVHLDSLLYRLSTTPAQQSDALDFRRDLRDLCDEIRPHVARLASYVDDQTDPPPQNDADDSL